MTDEVIAILYRTLKSAWNNNEITYSEFIRCELAIQRTLVES